MIGGRLFVRAPPKKRGIEFSHPWKLGDVLQYRDTRARWVVDKLAAFDTEIVCPATGLRLVIVLALRDAYRIVEAS